LQPLVTAGMAKDPERRPENALSFVDQLQIAAVAGYGEGWLDRGRSHLAEAALLLAALWPDPPPAVQGTAVERVSLLQRAGLLARRIGPLRAALALAAAAVVAAAITALASSYSQPPVTLNGTPVDHSVLLMPQHVVVKKHYKNGEEWYTATWGACPVGVKPRPKPRGYALYTVSFPNPPHTLQFVHVYEPPKDLYLAFQSHPTVNAGCTPVLPSTQPSQQPSVRPTVGQSSLVPPTTGPPTIQPTTAPPTTTPPTTAPPTTTPPTTAPPPTTSPPIG